MKSWMIVLCIIMSSISASCWAHDRLPETDNALQPGFEELECFLNHDKETDVVRIYHSQSQDDKGTFPSVAIFSLRRKGEIIPIYILKHDGDRPHTLYVKPFDFDDDGISEFLIETFYVGNHVTQVVRVLKLREASDTKVSAEVLFSKEYYDSGGEVRIESLNRKGHYRLVIGKESIHLMNGKEQKEGDQ